MNRLIQTLAVVTAALMSAGTVEAGGRNGGTSSSRGNGHSMASSHHDRGSHERHDHRDYHTRYGTKFEHGYFYRGHDHYHWSRYCWNPRYRCNFYYDPGVCSWYYWCASQQCYYPSSYIETAAPTPVAAPVATAKSDVTQVVTVQTGPGATQAAPPPGPPPGSEPPMPYVPPAQQSQTVTQQK